MQIYCNTVNIKSSFIFFEFTPVLIFLVIAIVLALIIVVLSYLLSVQNPETEKLSVYECGFEPYEDARNIFDVKFYLVAILFIIFDIETMFLLPWSMALSQLNSLGFLVYVRFHNRIGSRIRLCLVPWCFRMELIVIFQRKSD